jgi:glc operon protein GlcG
VPLQGGIPLEHDGQVVGAIGVSGASSADEDQELALLGAAALDRAGGNGAAYFDRETLRRRFAEGGLLVDHERFKLDAGRRVVSGEAELHAGVVDVMHVVQGSATVVTGGELRDVREVAPGELRAASVEGGTARRLEEGDVLAIPDGVPHQFVDVTDPFLYFVVKVAA